MCYIGAYLPMYHIYMLYVYMLVELVSAQHALAWIQDCVKKIRETGKHLQHQSSQSINSNPNGTYTTQLTGPQHDSIVLYAILPVE